jgi:hypothetical protein
MVALYHSASEIGIGTAMGTGRGGMEQQGASWIKELGTRFVCVEIPMFVFSALHLSHGRRFVGTS